MAAVLVFDEHRKQQHIRAAAVGGLESDPVVLQCAVFVETIDQSGPLLGIDDAIEPIGADEVVRLGHVQHAAHGRVRLEEGRLAAPRAAEDAEAQSIGHGAELLARLVESGLHGFLPGQAARDENDPVLTRERDGGDREHHVDGPPRLGLEASFEYGASLWVALPAAGAAGALLAFLLGKAILRLRGSFFALATIGVNEAMRALFNNLPRFGGSTGIALNFSVYEAYGGATRALWLAYGLMIALTLATLLISYRTKTSKFGLGLMAIREDEDAAEVLGVVTPTAKTWAYVLSAIMPAMAGVLYYFKNSSIEPNDAFQLSFSIELLVMVMLGGSGTVLGPVLGAAGYQLLRNSLLISPFFKNSQLVVSGVLLLLIILFIPVGAVGWLRRRFPRLRKTLI